jgi:hypothetical protein
MSIKKLILADFCIFFFSFTALAALVFLAGNFQGFTARTQMLLLGILKFSSCACLLAGAGYLAYLAAQALRKSAGLAWRDFALAGASLVFGLAALLVSQFIIVITLPKF